MDDDISNADPDTFLSCAFKGAWAYFQIVGQGMYVRLGSSKKRRLVFIESFDNF